MNQVSLVSSVLIKHFNNITVYVGIADLFQIKIFLKGVVDWQSLGLALGLLYPTLKRIKKEQHGDINDCSELDANYAAIRFFKRLHHALLSLQRCFCSFKCPYKAFSPPSALYLLASAHALNAIRFQSTSGGGLNAMRIEFASSRSGFM